MAQFDHRNWIGLLPALVLLLAAGAGFLMPLKQLAARGFGLGRLRTPVANSQILRSNSTKHVQQAINSSKAAQPTAASKVATRSYSEKANMSTQQYKYREPIVFNARDKHTGACNTPRNRQPSCSAGWFQHYNHFQHTTFPKLCIHQPCSVSAHVSMASSSPTALFHACRHCDHASRPGRLW